jgi:hypothetical protein
MEYGQSRGAQPGLLLSTLLFLSVSIRGSKLVFGLKPTLLVAFATSLTLTACEKPAVPTADAIKAGSTASPEGEIESPGVLAGNESASNTSSALRPTR